MNIKGFITSIEYEEILNNPFCKKLMFNTKKYIDENKNINFLLNVEDIFNIYVLTHFIPLNCTFKRFGNQIYFSNDSIRWIDTSSDDENKNKQNIILYDTYYVFLGLFYSNKFKQFFYLFFEPKINQYAYISYSVYNKTFKDILVHYNILLKDCESLNMIVAMMIDKHDLENSDKIIGLENE